MEDAVAREIKSHWRKSGSIAAEGPRGPSLGVDDVYRARSRCPWHKFKLYLIYRHLFLMLWFSTPQCVTTQAHSMKRGLRASPD